MIRLLIPFAALVLAVPATAQQAKPLTLEHTMLLRCSAAFALVATRQAGGDAAALQYPPMKERGGEFFVRSSAKVMEEAGLDRAAIAAALTQEAKGLLARGGLAAVMPACLAALDAFGL